jgi:uncharacterized membrane protein HdeD (DUF308 family)
MANGIVAVVHGQVVNELWGVEVAQAVLAIFFGITAIFWPGLTLVVLVYLFSAFILGLGVLEAANGLMSINRRETWWIRLLIGVIGIGSGVYLVRHPAVSFGTFIVVVGLVLIARGLMDIVQAIMDKTSNPARMLLALIGISAVIAGILVLSQPVIGGVAFVWILGVYALILGIFGLAIAWELRSLTLPPFPEVATGRKRRET